MSVPPPEDASTRESDQVVRTYWERRLAKNFGLYGVGFQRLGPYYNRTLYRVRRRVFKRAIRRIDVKPRDARILDVGSGSGFYVERWLAAGAKNIVATDITAVSVHGLAGRYPGMQVLQLDIGDAPEQMPARGSFDVVSAFDVLFHIVDDERYARAISNAAALLRPGGWFLFSENLPHHGTERYAYQVNRSLEEVERLVHGAGFEIVRRSPMFVLMNTPVDSTDERRKERWERLVERVASSERTAKRIALTRYPLELVLTAFAREGPSTEVMICRKTG